MSNSSRSGSNTLNFVNVPRKRFSQLIRRSQATSMWSVSQSSQNMLRRQAPGTSCTAFVTRRNRFWFLQCLSKECPRTKACVINFQVRECHVNRRFLHLHREQRHTHYLLVSGIFSAGPSRQARALGVCGILDIVLNCLACSCGPNACPATS